MSESVIDDKEVIGKSGALNLSPHTHAVRARALLKKHPEIKNYFGPAPMTAFWIFFVVGVQFLASYLVRHEALWVNLLVAFTIGATCIHSLFVLLHDCTHNVVLKKVSSNKFMGIMTNLPCIFPSAMGFRKYHLMHHRFLGQLAGDTDLAGPKETKIIGNNPLMKALWLSVFPLIQGVVRPARVGKIKMWDSWAYFNVLVSVGAAFAVFYFWGMNAFLYLLFSLFFALGLHPYGARWIQEHYIFKPGQETYSYYGPLNKLAFNIGYHNEHHDFPTVPWNHLPKIREIAANSYNQLYYHNSWLKVLFRFIFDPKMGLQSRVVRDDEIAKVDLHRGYTPKKKVGDADLEYVNQGPASTLS